MFDNNALKFSVLNLQKKCVTYCQDDIYIFNRNIQRSHVNNIPFQL